MKFGFDRTRWICMIGLALTVTRSFGSEEPMTTPEMRNIGSRLELMVDRYLVDRMDGVEFRMHEPQPQPMAQSSLVGPGFHPAVGIVTVIQDVDRYRAYYRDCDVTFTGKRFSGHPGEITCYAESVDGREWTFPQLGLYKVSGSRGNNVILARQRPFSHNFSPFLDVRPGVDPAERYKALAGHPGQNRKVKADGLHAFVSPDGIRWTRKPGGAVIPYNPKWYHAFDSQNVSFWSAAEGCYVCYFRTYETPHGQLRTIFRTTSTNFAQWTAPVPMNPNLPGEELYTSQTHPYFRAPHLYIALPTRYIAGQVGTKKTDAMMGSTDILFMTTRAGSTAYDRLFTEAFIRPGLDPERWDSRANYAALNVVPTGSNEMSIYHGKSGVRYTLRTDGFISIRAGAQTGEWLTRPLIFTGSGLILNLSSSAAGGVQVEIQDESGKPLPGFELAACQRAIGDAIEYPVRWTGDPDLGALAGKPVRLRFVMTECDIFALRFR